MRYPPALTFTPRESWVYRAATFLVIIILIAACVEFMPASGSLPIEYGVFLSAALIACLLLLRDAWKRPQGSLRYAQGRWQWVRDSQEVGGTCVLHLDLQSYMLVSFTAHSAQNELFQTTQWFHLEARHADHAASPANTGAWLALRRAVCSSLDPADEALAA